MEKSPLTRTVTIRILLRCIVFFVACGIAAVASAQTQILRIVTYNIQDDTGGVSAPRLGLIAPSSGGSVTNGGVLEGIGEEILAGNSQPIDILALQETTNSTLTVQPILNGLNVFYSSRLMSPRYAMSSLVLTTTGGTGGGPSAMVYNTNTVQLVASVGVGTSSGSGAPRQVGRYLFAPAGVATNASNIFYVYVSHAKSGTTASDINRRAVEAGIMRTDSATLASNSRILYVGDFNDSRSSEQMYQTLVGTGTGIPGFDPVNPSGASGIDWGTSTSDTNILKVLSESATNFRFRDDYQMVTSNVLYGVGAGLALVPGTYHVFGVNGTTAYNGTVNSGGNTSLNSLNTNGVGITAAQLRQYLTTATDHLPVVADYTIPVPDASPVASFTGNPTNGTEALTVTFTDTSTGNITNRFWDFGDGGTAEVTTNSVAYTYYSGGTYTVTLIVSGPDGVSTNIQVNYINVLTTFQAWQIQYFGNTNNPTADADGDGQNNFDEFQAGTDPTNSASVFRITSVVRTNDDIQITWKCGTKNYYVVQSSSPLADGSYTNDFTDLNLIYTSGGAGSYVDIGGATNMPARYYRVLLYQGPL